MKVQESNVIAYYPFSNPMNKFIDISQAVIIGLGYELCGIKEIGRYRCVILNWFENLPSNKYRKYKKYFEAFRKILFLKACKLKDIKIIVVFHNRYPHDVRTSILQKHVISKVYESADKIIILSRESVKYEKELSGRDLRDKFYYIPHPNYIGAYPDVGIRKEPSEKLRLLFFGMIRPYKNIELIIRAASELKGEPVDFIIVGKPITDDYASELMNLVKGLNNVKMHLGFVEDDGISRYLESCDALLLPYDSSCLNSGTSLLAFSFAKTVVSPKIATVMDFDESLLYAYDVKDEKWHYPAMLGAIQRILNDYKLRKDSIAKKGLWLYKAVQSDNSVERISELYKELFTLMSFTDHAGGYWTTAICKSFYEDLFVPANSVCIYPSGRRDAA